jgi:hypothetical protein
MELVKLIGDNTMAKYMILYNSTASAAELMANASPEEMQASMAEWVAWKDEVSKTVAFDFGMPLQAVSQVTTDDVTDSTSQVSGYSIMEGDSKEAIVKLLQSHPHLKRPGASIDVLEMLAMPGM